MSRQQFMQRDINELENESEYIELHDMTRDDESDSDLLTNFSLQIDTTAIA